MVCPKCESNDIVRDFNYPDVRYFYCNDCGVDLHIEDGELVEDD